jgi:hypothetical protein
MPPYSIQITQKSIILIHFLHVHIRFLPAGDEKTPENRKNASGTSRKGCGSAVF